MSIKETENNPNEGHQRLPLKTVSMRILELCNFGDHGHVNESVRMEKMDELDTFMQIQLLWLQK